jgi:hypothetical protein
LQRKRSVRGRQPLRLSQRDGLLLLEKLLDERSVPERISVCEHEHRPALCAEQRGHDAGLRAHR